MLCPHCCSAKTMERSGTWLSALPVPGLRAGLQRADRLGAEPVSAANRRGVFDRLVAVTDELSLRDLTEILLLRGLVFSHEAIREWEARLAPRLTDALRKRRKGNHGAGPAGCLAGRSGNQFRGLLKPFGLLAGKGWARPSPKRSAA